VVFVTFFLLPFGSFDIADTNLVKLNPSNPFYSLLGVSSMTQYLSSSISINLSTPFWEFLSSLWNRTVELARTFYSLLGVSQVLQSEVRQRGDSPNFLLPFGSFNILNILQVPRPGMTFYSLLGVSLDSLLGIFKKLLEVIFLLPFGSFGAIAGALEKEAEETMTFYSLLGVSSGGRCIEVYCAQRPLSTPFWEFLALFCCFSAVY